MPSPDVNPHPTVAAAAAPTVPTPKRGPAQSLRSGIQVPITRYLSPPTHRHRTVCLSSSFSPSSATATPSPPPAAPPPQPHRHGPPGSSSPAPARSSVRPDSPPPLPMPALKKARSVGHIGTALGPVDPNTVAAPSSVSVSTSILERPANRRRQSARLSQLPPPDGADPDKRKLRSHHSAAGLKSVLARYFPNYHALMTGTEAISVVDHAGTTIEIVDETVDGIDDEPGETGTRKGGTVPALPPRTPLRRADFAAIAVPANKPDPLDDEHYLKLHKHGERKEKHVRNLEKEHVQHEKNHLVGLLADLQGPRWQHVMGIAGSAEAGKREWETKRDYFVNQVDALVAKFRAWKDEEKLLRQRRRDGLTGLDAAVLELPPPPPSELSESPVRSEFDGDHSPDGRPDRMDVDTDGPESQADDDDDGDPESDPDTDFPPPPPSSAFSFTFSIPPGSSPLFGPITSFFSDPHVRSAALARRPVTPGVSGSDTPELTTRRSDTTVWAFGAPIPDFPSAHFLPPPDLITDVNLKAHARRRRRQRRETRSARR